MVRKILYVLMVVTILISIVSCEVNSTISTTHSPTSSSSFTSTYTPPSTNTSPTSTINPPPVITDTEVFYPFDFYLELSRIPQPNETAELIFAVSLTHPNLLDPDMPEEGLVNSKIWLDFYWIDLEGSFEEAKHGVMVPLSEVIINGETAIQGNVQEKDFQCNSTIQLPREGIWKIVGNVQGEGWIVPETVTKMYVIKDGYTFDYSRSLYSDLAGSPLAYLTYFNYGQIGFQILSEGLHPVIQELDISKAPLAGEMATVTVKITSLHDVTGFSSEIEFWYERGHKKISPEGVYINGNYSWSGDLKAGTQVIYSGDIKLPDDGEWYIVVGGSTEEYSKRFPDFIELTVNKVRSFFGWKPQWLSLNISTGPSQLVIALLDRDKTCPYALNLFIS